MNAVKRQNPTISPDDIERLLFHLEDARNYIVKYGAAQGFNSQARKVANQTASALDDMAGQITGDRQHLWEHSASAGGNENALEQGSQKEAKRRRFLGVHIPVRMMKIVG